MVHWYIYVLKKYAVLDGRAQRKEFWLFSLFNLLVLLGMAVLADLFPSLSVFIGGLCLLYILAVLIPWAAVSVRRLHDVGHAGWWLPFGFVSFIGGIVLRAGHIGGGLIHGIVGFGFIWMLLLMGQDSHQGTNRYGSDPKETKDLDNEDFTALLKSAVNEKRFDTIPDIDLVDIHRKARIIDKSRNALDIEMLKAINTLSDEIARRGLQTKTI